MLKDTLATGWFGTSVIRNESKTPVHFLLELSGFVSEAVTFQSCWQRQLL